MNRRMVWRAMSVWAAAAAVVSIAAAARAADGGLIVYLPMDAISGGVVKDASGGGNDGILTAGGKLIDSKVGAGIELAAADEIQLNDGGVMDGFDMFTVEMWVRTDAHQATGLIQKGANWDADISYLIQPWSDQNIYFGIKTTSSRAITKAGDYPLGAWYHLAGVFDGAELRLYIDGKEKAKAAAPAGVKVVPDTDLPVQLGNRFAGAIDEFILYKRVLTEAEIQKDMTGQVLAVEPNGKAAAAWAALKR